MVIYLEVQDRVMAHIYSRYWKCCTHRGSLVFLLLINRARNMMHNRMIIATALMAAIIAGFMKAAGSPDIAEINRTHLLEASYCLKNG